MEAPTLNKVLTTFNVRHEVEDFEKWHALYLQNSNPEARIGVLRNIDNPNDVFVGEKTESHDSARAFMESEDLKTIMKDAGVSSVPKIRFLNIKTFQPATTESIYRVSIIHEVANFDAWKSTFDQDEANRVASGIHVTGVGTSEDNPSEVFIMFAVKDLDKAKAYIQNPNLKDLMEKAGVRSAPEITYWKMF